LVYEGGRGASAQRCKADKWRRQRTRPSRALISPQGTATLLTCRCPTIAPHSSFLAPTNGRALLYRVGSAVIAQFELHPPTLIRCCSLRRCPKLPEIQKRGADPGAVARRNLRLARVPARAKSPLTPSTSTSTCGIGTPIRPAHLYLKVDMPYRLAVAAGSSGPGSH
jgi:hypothetical protein